MTKGCIGLIAQDKAIPLDGVRVEARMSGPCVDVRITQRYCNCERVPVEAVYVFPLDEGSAVCGFSVRIQDKVIAGQVLPREQAFANYDDALADGDGAYLLEQERPNVFTASIGNLAPDASVEIELRYVTLAAREGDALRLSIPTTVSPRYAPPAPPKAGQPETERVNPETWLRVPYGLSLRVDVSGSLRRLESPSHTLRTSLSAGGATLELTQDDAPLDRDFVLLVEPLEPARPFARVAREADGTRVALVCFQPNLSAAASLGHEVTFVLDCSGSMRGSSIEQAKRALALCVRALGSADAFNVIRFGSSQQALWKDARPYTEATLDEATRYIQSIEADLGGTEIAAPLRAALEANSSGERARSILLLTDGQVSNDREIIAMVREHAGRCRVFTFGIGAGASEYLVRGVARAARGAAEMILPGERIEPKVLRALARLRTPALPELKLDWHGLGVRQAPAEIPPVFAGDVLSVFARIESGSSECVTLQTGDQRWDVAIDLEQAEAEGPIPRLWARERIRELEEDGPQRGSQQASASDRREQQLVELSRRYSLLCSATSFVAVEQRAPGERVRELAQLRRIPVALTNGWGGSVRTRGGAAPVALAGPPLGVLVQGGFPTLAALVTMQRIAEGATRDPAAARSRRERLFNESDIAGAPAPATNPEPSHDRLFDLLMTQRADGHFECSPELEAWLGEPRMRKLKQAMRVHGEHASATAAVIALLSLEAQAEAAEWRPAVAKARAWLAKQPEALDPALGPSIVERA